MNSGGDTASLNSGIHSGCLDCATNPRLSVHAISDLAPTMMAATIRPWVEAMMKDEARRGPGTPPNMRMHLPKPRAPWWPAERVTSASSQVIRGR
jgi:hypothetical protein